MPWSGAVLAVVYLALSPPACTFDTSGVTPTRQESSVSDGPAAEQLGFMEASTGIDAHDATSPDGPTPDVPAAQDGPAPDGFVCPAGCICLGQSCTKRCTGADCRCPAGMSCTLDCTGPGDCSNDVDCGEASSCEILCGPSSSSCNGTILCGSGPCTVSCTGDACTGKIYCGSGPCSINCFDDTCTNEIYCGDGPCSISCMNDSCLNKIWCKANRPCDISCSGSSCADDIECSGACKCGVVCIGSACSGTINCLPGCTRMSGKGCDPCDTCP